MPKRNEPKKLSEIAVSRLLFLFKFYIDTEYLRNISKGFKAGKLLYLMTPFQDLRDDVINKLLNSLSDSHSLRQLHFMLLLSPMMSMLDLSKVHYTLNSKWFINMVFSQCKNLTNLSLSGQIGISCHHIENIIKMLPCLRNLNLSRTKVKCLPPMEQLRSLNVSYTDVKLPINSPKLQIMHANGTVFLTDFAKTSNESFLSHYPDLIIIHCDGILGHILQQRLPYSKLIALVDEMGFSCENEDYLDSLSSLVPNLQLLHIPFKFPSGLRTLMLYHLTDLCVGGLDLTFKQDILPLLRSMGNNFTRLSLSQVKDVFLCDLSVLCPNLLYLYIYTKDDLKARSGKLKGFGKLRFLTIISDVYINSTDETVFPLFVSGNLQNLTLSHCDWFNSSVVSYLFNSGLLDNLLELNLIACRNVSHLFIETMVLSVRTRLSDVMLVSTCSEDERWLNRLRKKIKNENFDCKLKWRT